MNVPLISIGLPVFNGEPTIAKALDSILAQDYKNLELIISDNASTDRTQSICEGYAKQDNRVRYYRNHTNMGVSPNHNRVFELSSGKYFSWGAHDVELMPGMLRKCIAILEQSASNLVLVYPLCELVDTNGQPIVTNQISIASSDPRPDRRASKVIRNLNYVTQHYGVFVSDLLRRTRLNGSYASSDYVLTAELAMLGEIRELPETLVRRRMAKDSGTNAVLHSQKAWAKWLDPNPQNQRIVLPLRERLALEYLRSVCHLPLKTSDRIRCFISVPFAHYRRSFALKFAPWRLRIARNLGRIKRVLHI